MKSHYNLDTWVLLSFFYNSILSVTVHLFPIFNLLQEKLSQTYLGFINYFFDFAVQITIVPVSRLSTFQNNTKTQYKTQTTAKEPDQTKQTITTGSD